MLYKALFLAVALAGLMAAISSADVSHTCNFTQGNLSIEAVVEPTDGRTYHHLTMPECWFKTEPEGSPEIPYKSITLVFPANEAVTGITITGSDYQEISGQYDVYPSQPPVKITVPATEFVPPDPASYASPQPYPGGLVEIVHDGYLSGYHLISLRVYPVQYLPAAGKLNFYTSISFIVETQTGASGAVPVHRRSILVQKEMEKLVGSLVENQQMVPLESSKFNVIDYSKSAKGTVVGPLNVKTFPSDDGSGVDYLIITGRALADGFQPLADWKYRKGLVAQIRTVEWIEANYHGCDRQEKLRRFIKDAYTYWGVGYVLLAGDTRIIPERRGAGWIPTDLYYSSLEGNWNANGNSTFGEFSGDGVDLFPDIAVGRASVETSEEVDVFISKVISYEQNPEADYLTKMLFLGICQCNSAAHAERVQLDWPTGAGLTDEFKQNKYELYAPVVDPDPNHTPPYWTGDDWLNKTNTMAKMNEGYHLIWHVDHCTQYLFGTGRDSNSVYEEKQMNRLDVSYLTNDNKPFILWTLGCDPNAFDYECISESFMGQSGKAAVGFIGNTVTGYFGYEWQGLKIFTSLFHDNLFHLGDAFRSVQGMNGNFYGAYNQNLLGEPEMPVWKDQPHQLAVAHPASVTIGPNTISITVSDQATGFPIESALVCLQKGIEAFAAGYTDVNGQLYFDYTPITTGVVNITAVVQDHIPYQGSITVSPTAKYICYQSAIFDDDDIGGTAGNGDGIANPGETADMLIALKNTGSMPVEKINVYLSTDSPFIMPNVFNAYRTNAIDPGGSANCDQAIRCEIDSDCPDHQRVIFHMTSTSGAYAWADSFAIVIKADSLAHTGHKMVELAGNGDGFIDPGERIQIANLEVTNFGAGAADGVVAELATDDPYITIENSLSTVGPIPSDGKMTEPNGFTFSVSPSAPAGRVYEFILTINDRFGRQWVKSNYELIPLSAPTGLNASSSLSGAILRWNTVAGSAGYNIYRGLFPGGPYDKINRHAVTKVSYYTDENIQPQTQYFYVVTSLDMSSNESAFSNEVSLLCPLAYKPGWPQVAGTRGDLNFNSALTGDIDGDGDKEVVLGSNDGHIFAWHHDGTAVSGWPRYFPASLVSVALGDINKDGITDIIAGVGDANSFRVFAWDGSGNAIFENTLYSGAGSKTESVISLGDLDRNGRLDIVIGCKAPKRVYAAEWDGAALINKWNASTDAGWPVGVAVANLNSDDNLEVVVGTWSTTGTVYSFDHQGILLWQKELITGGYAPNSFPVIGDMTGDGSNEIVVAASCDNAGLPRKCFVLNGQGDILFSWNIDGMIWGSPALADLDGDGDLEIIAGRSHNNNGLIAWHHNGSIITGWPKTTGYVYSSPAATDVDLDRMLDIFAGGYPKNIWGFSGDGSTYPGYPLPTVEATYSSPFVCDLDNNGRAELGLDMFDGKVHVWEFTENTSSVPEWPMFHHDAMSSGRHGWLNEFNGPITRDLTLSGDNFFNGDVVIEPGAEVTLRPSARLYFAANRDVKNLGTDPNRCELIVKGSLEAQGAEGDEIRFLAWAAEKAPGDWHGIRIEPGGTAMLKHCVIENAETAVTCDGCSPRIELCRIQNCNDGINVFGGDPVISCNSITNNMGAGIYCRQSSAQISDNLIANNGYETKNMMALLKALGDSSSQKGRDSTGTIGTGIVSYESNLTVTGNTIRENYTGFYSSGAIRGTITGNTFEDNVFQGMDLMATSLNIAIAGNNFINNGGVYNWPWELAGISIGYRNLNEPSSAQIENNTFLGNFAGARCTRYGRNATNKLMLWLRGNTFVDGNQVGFSVSADMDPNLEVIGVNNRFEKNDRYGVIVHSLNAGLVNLGNLGNSFKGDDGGNRLNGNLEYELYHNAPGTMMAEGNYWNSKVPKDIDSRIYDDNENPSCGPVDFEPFYFWGELEADAVWSGTVSLAGDVVVPSDVTLQIESGTTIRFAANMDASASGSDPAKSELIVHGELDLAGRLGRDCLQ